MNKDYKEYFDENGILREFPTANKIREITSRSINNKVIQELIDLQEVIIEKAAAGEYIFTWYTNLQDETVKFLDSLGYKVAIAHDGIGNKYDISWEEESLCKPKEEKPEFKDDEIGAIAQEYGYVFKHLRDCTIGEIVKICDDPDWNCDECKFGTDHEGICDLHLRKLTEADLETIVRVRVPKINKEKLMNKESTEFTKDNVFEFFKEKYNQRKDKEDISRIGISDADFRQFMIDYLLGNDWYVVDPVGQEQINEIALHEILSMYSKRYKKEIRENV